jgi:hypothetical protein
MALPQTIVDSHIHFFLSTPVGRARDGREGYTEEQLRRIRERFDRNLRERAQPAVDRSLTTPAQYAARWREEFDRHGIAAGVFLALDETLAELREFVAHEPERFIPYGWVDPLDPAAPDTLARQKEEVGIRGLKLISTTQWFHPYDQRIWPLYRRAEELRLPILIHCGVSIGYMADFRYANPLDLQPALRDFPDLPFLLAHFGAGFFREALLLCYQCPNLFLDTSSSNIWMRYQDTPLTIRDVFARALDAAGPERIVFGTDSSYFPRGFRRDILEEQHRALEELGVAQGEMELIFGGNLRRLHGG